MGSRQIGVIVVLVAYASIYQEWLCFLKVLLGNLLHFIAIQAIKMRPSCSLK